MNCGPIFLFCVRERISRSYNETGKWVRPNFYLNVASFRSQVFSFRHFHFENELSSLDGETQVRLIGTRSLGVWSCWKALFNYKVGERERRRSCGCTRGKWISLRPNFTPGPVSQSPARKTVQIWGINKTSILRGDLFSLFSL